MTTNELIDKMEIAELVALFSIYADQKKIKEQAELFTKNATLISYMGKQKVADLHGRTEIYKSCNEFMSLFETAHHMNGQHLINIADSINATGTVYNVTTLIGKDEKGNKTATKNNIYYEDTYEKVNSKWFIAKRISYFVYSEKILIK